MIIVLDKDTGSVRAYASVLSFCRKNDKFKKDTLSYHFSRLKRKEYETEQLRIIRTKVIK